MDKKIASFDDYIKRLIEVVAMKEKLAQGDVEDVDINLEDADMVRNFTEKNINKNYLQEIGNRFISFDEFFGLDFFLKKSYAIFLFLVF